MNANHNIAHDNRNTDTGVTELEVGGDGTRLASPPKDPELLATLFATAQRIPQISLPHKLCDQLKLWRKCARNRCTIEELCERIRDDDDAAAFGVLQRRIRYIEEFAERWN